MRPFASVWIVSAAAAAAMAVAGPARAAGAVQVSFVKPERFTDIGFGTRDREEVLKQLQMHLTTLGEQRLADGQTLKVDVLDVDLAGREKPMGGRGDIRVLNGRVDWPRIQLHYVLEAGGQVLRSGNDSLTDMNYLGHLPNRSSGEPLRYEKAMLDSWFKSRFGSGPAAAGTATPALP